MTAIHEPPTAARCPRAPAPGGGHRDDRRVRGLGLQGGAVPRPPRRRADAPAHRACSTASPPTPTGGATTRRSRRRSSEDVGRKVSADNVRFLVEKKLRPLGVLAAADGSSPELERPDPLLALKFRTAVIPEALHARADDALPAAVLAARAAALAIAGFLALDAWLFLDARHRPGAAPRDLPAAAAARDVRARVVIATAFHETGHATACRYGGARPGVMGVGLYIVWPAFYTDVTDAYRLGRGGRLRTDLGGIYFNAIFALAAGGAVRAHGLRAAAAARAAPDTSRCSSSCCRSCGSTAITSSRDLTGVPDMLSRIKPVFRSLVPGARRTRAWPSSSRGCASWSPPTCCGRAAAACSRC